METPVLLPRERLLLAAAAPRTLAPQARAELLRDPSIAWDDLLRLALDNRLVNQVWALLSSASDAPTIDASSAGRWRLAHRAALLRHSAARGQLAELSAAMAARSVRCLLYKGLDFSTRYYPEKSPRGFTDLDLVVERERTEAAHAALSAAGYRAPPRSPPLEYYRRFHLHAVYRHPEWPFTVELHWALDSPYAATPDPLPAIFAAAVEAPELGPGVLRPCPLDALALMVIHLEKHLALCAELPTAETRLKAAIDAGGLVWLLDVAAWMRREGPRRPADTVMRRAQALGAIDSLRCGLRLARDLDPQALPDWAQEWVAAAPFRTSLLCRAVYPDLVTGGAETRLGRRVRSVLLAPLPVWTFRPVRVLEALAGRHGPAVEGGPILATLHRIALLARRVAENLWWIARWKLRRRLR